MAKPSVSHEPPVRVKTVAPPIVLVLAVTLTLLSVCSEMLPPIVTLVSGSALIATITVDVGASDRRMV